MYGIVNKAIEDLVTEKFGEEAWLAVKEKSGIDIDYFLTTEPYDDAITYKLAGAAAEVSGLTVSEVLNHFGEWWVLRTSKEKYGGLMEAGGSNLADFLRNLPAFHSRIMMIYPKLQPPEFRVEEFSEQKFHVHYYSNREGLQDFVSGILVGLGKMYNIPDTSVTLISGRNDQQEFDTFMITW